MWNGFGNLAFLGIYPKTFHNQTWIEFSKTPAFNYLFLTGLIVMVFGLATIVLTNQADVTALYFRFTDLLISIYIFLIVALVEEMLVRGYLLNTLLQNDNKKTALIISALIFSAMHFFNPHIGVIATLNLFLAGLLLGIPALYTGNIWSSAALHFSWNFFQSLFGFNVSGKDLYSLIILREHKENIWNGGMFGYEASVYCLFSQAIAIVFFYKMFNRKQETHNSLPISTCS